MPPDQITADLRAVMAQVAALPAGNSKVAVAGFCWGGSETFRFATPARIQAPVYGFYGGNAARVNASIPAPIEAMKKLGQRFAAVLYEGAGHGFMRAGEVPNASEANCKARVEAWERWKTLLKGLRTRPAPACAGHLVSRGRKPGAD